MNSIAFDVENEKRFSSRIQKFFRRYQISGILKKCNAYKEQGFSVVTLIQYLFCLVFRNRSMFLDMQSEKAPEFKKDTVYRLKKECGKSALWKHKSKGIQEFNIEKRVFMAYAHVIGLLGE